MGLVILGALALYLLISIFVVIGATKYAKKNGKSAIRWGLGATLLMYLIPFWDALPTMVVHQHYCKAEAGYWVYKTLDQWKKENTGVMETLSPPLGSGSPTRYEPYDHERGKKTTYLLNERFNWVVSQQDDAWLLPLIRTEHEVRDVKKNELLARYVDFATGNSVKNTIGPPGPLKFWLKNSNCSGGAINKSKLLHFAHSVEKTRSQGAGK